MNEEIEIMYNEKIRGYELNRSIMWLLPILMCTVTSCKKTEQITMSGNPLFEGWYADPEAIIYVTLIGFILHTPTLMKNKFF